MIFLIASLNVAAETVTSAGIPFSLRASQTIVEGEDAFTVTFYTNADSGLISGSFYIAYDKNVFERDTQNDAVGKLPTGENAFSYAILNDDTPGITYLVLANDTAKKGTDCYTLGFKVKAGAASQTSTFNIGVDDQFGVAISDGTELGFNEYFQNGNFVLTDVSVKVKAFSTTTSVTVGSNILFNVEITDCPDSGIIYAAVYDGAVLKACGECKFTAALENTQISVENVSGDSAKIFIWDENGVPLLKVPESIDITTN